MAPLPAFNWFGGLARALLLAPVLVLGAVVCANAEPRPLPVTAEPVALMPEEPARSSVGELSYLGGIVLRAEDGAFGGISGLAVDPETLWAVMVTDSGSWIEGQLVFENSRLTGLSNARIGPMLDTRGRASLNKRKGDAEAVERVGDAFVVSFENDHKLWRYAAPGFDAPFATPAEDLGLPADFRGVPGNGALESVTVADGGLVLLTERALDAGGDTRGWIGPVSGAPSRFGAFTLITDAPYSPTDMAALPGGDLLVLERSYSPFTGVMVQLRRMSGRALRPLARLPARTVAQLGRGYSVDNMEGLAVVPLASGQVLVLMISDDNFNATQKTILLAFTMTP